MIPEQAHSPSEDHGLALLSDADKMIYSVGISTGGAAELRMAEGHPERHIVATTIDDKGVDEAKSYIEQKGFSGQIEVKHEDVAKPLPYPDSEFDFIYARLVLHYLNKQQLGAALIELSRVLKPGGQTYIVVRSDQCPDAHLPSSRYDSETGLTSYRRKNPRTGKLVTNWRFFHNEKSISQFVVDGGLKVEYVKSYQERLFGDFMRQKQSRHIDHVIELLARK